MPDDPGLPPEQMPDPWLFDSERLLEELARIRQLALMVPMTEKTFAPTNTVVEENLRYLLRLRWDGQNAFRKKAAVAERLASRKNGRTGTSNPAGVARI